MKNTLLLYSFLILFCACHKKISGHKDPSIASPASVSTPAPPSVSIAFKSIQPLNIPVGIDSNLVIRLQRTACFGKCPVFTLDVFANGTVFYKGIAHIKKHGEYKTTVNKAFINNIQQRAAAINFMALQNFYPSSDNMIADIPSTITYIRIGNYGKMIVDNFDAPKELMAFEKWLEKEMEYLNWTVVKP